MDDLFNYIPNMPNINIDPNALVQLETDIKYEGYIEKQKQEASRLAKLEEIKIPDEFKYEHLDGLRIEARQKLARVKPLTVGQAKRISGVNPNDIIILMTYLRKGK